MRIILRACVPLLLLCSLSRVQAKWDGWPFQKSSTPVKESAKPVEKESRRRDQDGIASWLRHNGPNDSTGTARAFARQVASDRRWQESKALEHRRNIDKKRICSAGGIIATLVGLKVLQTLVSKPGDDARGWRKMLFNSELERWVTLLPAAVWAANLYIPMGPSDSDLKDYEERANAAEKLLEDLVEQRDRRS